MKRLAMTIALTCVLSGSALAGEMDTGGFAPPPPPPTTETTSAASPGDIPTRGGFAEPKIGDEVIANVLGILCGLAI